MVGPLGKLGVGGESHRLAGSFLLRVRYTSSMHTKTIIVVLVALLVVAGAAFAWNTHDKPSATPPAIEMATSTGVSTTSMATTPNGFSFTLPEGWTTGAWESTTSPELQVAQLTDNDGIVVGDIRCPSLGRYEFYGTVPHTNAERTFLKDGTTYRVNYSTNANEHDTEHVVDAGVYVTPEDLTWEESVNKHPKSASTCFVSVEADSIRATTLQGLDTIYKTWK